jgi:formylglycine-generating enzyme required for sulfatase activity
MRKKIPMSSNLGRGAYSSAHSSSQGNFEAVDQRIFQVGKLNTYLGTAKLRLPTEAEWERAARGGATTSTPFSFGVPVGWSIICGSFPEAAANMWWCGNANGTSHPVGSFAANQFGLYDMHWNLFEWVLDDFDPSYPGTPQTDPSGPSVGSGRVVRGGAWAMRASGCRSAYRFGLDGSGPQSNLGFRLAMFQ